MTRRMIATGIMLLALGCPLAADAGQIYHEAVSLDALLAKGAQYIFVVKPAEPPSRSIEIPVKGGACGETCPPFAVHVSRFVIYEVLRAPAEAKGPFGATIEVAPAGIEKEYGLHWRCYVEGDSKSRSLPVYTPAGTGDPTKSPQGFIVFLARDGDERRGELKGLPTWSFAIEGAVEGLGMKTTILKKLKRQGE